MNFDKYLKRARVLKTRLYSGKYQNLSDNQKYLFEIVKRVSGGNPNRELERSIIEKQCGIDFNFNSRDNLITDFCYNKVNLQDNSNKFLYSPKAKIFQFVGFDWKSDSVKRVSWFIKEFSMSFYVGRYIYDHFEWNFDALIKYIEDERILSLKSELKLNLQSLGVRFPNNATYDKLYSLYKKHKKKQNNKKTELSPTNKKSKSLNTILIKGGSKQKNTTKREISNNELLKTIKNDLESINSEIHYREGKAKYSSKVYYERNPKLRTAAIIEHGTMCMACGFDFEKIYGLHGKNFIEVHHIKPISEFIGETKVSPVKDMIVLCSNCHSMIHRNRDKILSLEELKNLINRG